MAVDTSDDYPVTFDIAYPDSPSRWLIFVRWLLATPHYVVLAALGVIAGPVVVVAFFTILVAKTYPDALYRFMVGVARWKTNVAAYVLLLDSYPPFSMREGAYDGVTLLVERPAAFNRWLVLVKWLLVIPHVILLEILAVIAALALIPLAIALLVTGRYPRILFDFLVGVGRHEAHVSAYTTLLVDRYPRFPLR